MESRQHLREAMMLLEGKSQQLVRDLRAAMERAAEALRFEDAARLRDQIRAIERTQEKQQVVAHWGVDQDVFGLYREGGFIEAEVLFVRQGKLTGNQTYSFEDFEFPDEEVLRALLTQFYQGERYVPDEILVPADLEDADARAEYLSDRKGRRVHVIRPQRGDKVRLLEMAAENAQQSFRERQDADRKRERMSEELQCVLHLRNAPSKKIAYTDKRLDLWYVDLDKGTPVKAATDRFVDPSSAMNPAWSPDSQWLTYTKELENHLHAVFVYALGSGKEWQIADGISDARYPVFDKGGKYLLFAVSTDVGLRAGWLDLSSSQHPVLRSVYAAVLKKGYPSPVPPESDEEKVEPVKKDEKAPAKGTGADKGQAEKAKEEAAQEPVKVTIDFDGIGQRIVALPIAAANYVNLSAAMRNIPACSHSIRKTVLSASFALTVTLTTFS